MESKLNIGMKLSKDFQTVTCEFVDEIIEHDSDEELSAKIRKKYNFVKILYSCL